MNRRTFFARSVGAIVAAALAPILTPVVRWKSRLFTSMTYRGVPVVFDPMLPTNTIYFLAHNGPWRITGNGAEPLWTERDT